MKYIISSFLVMLVLVPTGTLVSGQDKGDASPRFEAGLMAGYNRGFGITALVSANDFTPGFPFDLRLGLGYTFLNPGNAADARRIFINDATNGVPDKKGRSVDLRLDFMLPTTLFGIRSSHILFGPRFSTFRGSFIYIGGNEEFDVKSSQWGLGGGIESSFVMTSTLKLVFSAGLDHYFPSTLTGHDTSYSPDNDNVNPQDDNRNEGKPFLYRDANKAIRQPMFMPRAMIGVEVDL